MRIVAETPEHETAVDALLGDAFGGPDEALLVRQLRAGGYVCVSLVAEDETGVTGHVMFSRLKAETAGRALKAAALAPLAVRRDRRGQGLGTRLMETGIEICRRARFEAIVVVGDPAFYGRAGFSAEKMRGHACPFAGPHLQGLELVRGTLTRGAGTIAYPPPFDRFIRGKPD